MFKMFKINKNYLALLVVGLAVVAAGYFIYIEIFKQRQQIEQLKEESNRIKNTVFAYNMHQVRKMDPHGIEFCDEDDYGEDDDSDDDFDELNPEIPDINSRVKQQQDMARQRVQLLAQQQRQTLLQQHAMRERQLRQMGSQQPPTKEQLIQEIQQKIRLPTGPSRGGDRPRPKIVLKSRDQTPHNNEEEYNVEEYSVEEQHDEEEYDELGDNLPDNFEVDDNNLSDEQSSEQVDADIPPDLALVQTFEQEN